MSERPSIRAAGATHAGLQRDQNEDRVLVDAARGVFCVVDGVGGHPGGERAAAIAIDMLEARLARETGSPAERLREAITLANNAILDEARKDPALAGMTCVLTAAIVAGRQLTVGHVGDTRLYKLRAGHLHKLTHDHSPVGEREDAGELTEDEAMRHPRRNEVYRDVGTDRHAPDDEQFVEVVETTFEADAAVLICSDGLSDQVSSASLRRILESHAGDPATAVEELIRAANDTGGKDNVSAIVVEGDAFGPPLAAGTALRRSSAAGGYARALLWFAAGVVVGLAAAAAIAWRLYPELNPFRQPAEQAAVPPAPRQARSWTVGLTGQADATSIADAMSRAQPGDTITLAPGDYREQIVVGQGVTLEGPPDAVVRPPLGAPADWTAILVSGVTGARLAGFSITAAEGQGLATGIQVERGEVEVRDVSASGATGAALVLRDGARATVSACTLSDNPGSGVVAESGSRLHLRHTAVMRNGTTAGRLRPGIRLAERVEARLVGNAVGDNGGGAVVGWPSADIATLVRDNLVRPAPRPTQVRTPGDAPRRPAAGRPVR